MLFIIYLGWGWGSLNSLNIWDLVALVLSLSDLRPTLHLLLDSVQEEGLPGQALPAWFGTCEALVRDWEGMKGRSRVSLLFLSLSLSLSPWWVVQQWFASS